VDHAALGFSIVSWLRDIGQVVKIDLTYTMEQVSRLCLEFSAIESELDLLSIDYANLLYYQRVNLRHRNARYGSLRVAELSFSRSRTAGI
jgi:hypothetical protein